MTSSDIPSHFPSAFATRPRAPTHTLASSIWAPKLPRNFDSWSPPSPGSGGPFARPFDEDAVAYDRPPVPMCNSSFGTPAGLDFSAVRSRNVGASMSYSPVKKDVGVVGQGWQRGPPSPQHENEQQVESLMRALNLHSPSPQAQRPFLGIHIDTTPDNSPSSDVSSLATPGDLSPARFGLGLAHGLGLKFDSSLGLDLHGQYSPMQEQSRDRFMSNSNQSWDDQSLPYFPPPPAMSAFSRPAHGMASQLATPAQLNASLFDTYTDRPSPISFGGPLPGMSATSNQPQSSWPLQAQAPPMPMSPPQHGRGLSSSGWATPRQVVPPGQWLRSEEAQSPMNHYRGPASFAQPQVHTRAATNMSAMSAAQSSGHDPINFLSLLHPSSTPPYHVFVARIIKSSDQQASIFLQQKLKVADVEERGKIIEAICNRGFEMMSHRFGNWAVQRCLEAATTVEERRRIISCMRGRVVELAMNCYGCHVLQKALDCEEDIRLLIVTELLRGDPASSLVNKHASHVWSKVMELTWTPPAPPIFACINRSLHGQWAQLACHETGSLVVQHAFENLEDTAKAEIIDELLNRGSRVFGEVVKNQWGAYCIQHILEHGSPAHCEMVMDLIIEDLLDYATNEQASKSVNKALKEGGQDVTDRFVKRMAEPAKGARRAMIVDLALSVTGSQLIGLVLPTLNKEQRGLLYDSIRSHIVTLRGCKTGSKVIWLFDRMRAYYGY